MLQQKYAMYSYVSVIIGDTILRITVIIISQTSFHGIRDMDKGSKIVLHLNI